MIDREGGELTDVDPRAVDTRPSVFRNMVHMMTSQVGSWILGTITLVIVPRFLGPASVGRLHLTVSIWSIASVFVLLGTSGYLTLEMARDRQRAAGLVGPIMLLRLFAFGCAALVVAAISVVSGFDAELLMILVLTGCAALLMSLSDVLNSAMVGLEHMSFSALATIVPKAVFTLLLVAVLVPGDGGVIAVAALSIGNVALTFGMLWHYYRRFEIVTWRWTVADLRGVLRRSSGFFVAAAVIVIYLQIDTVVIAVLVDEETLGWYSTADVLASSALFVPTIVMSTLFPVISRLHAADPREAAEMARRALSLLMLAGVALGFGTIVVAEPVSVLLFGEGFRETGAVLAVLGAMMPFIFGTMMLGTIAMATDRRKFWNLIMMAAIPATIALDIVLVPWFDQRSGNGAIGGAVSYLVVESLMFVVALRKIAPGALTAQSSFRLLKIVVAGGVMVAVTWNLRDVFVLVPIAVGAVIFVGLVTAFGVLDADEKLLVIRLRSQLLARLGMRDRHAVSGVESTLSAGSESSLPQPSNDSPGGQQ